MFVEDQIDPVDPGHRINPQILYDLEGMNTRLIESGILLEYDLQLTI